MACKKPAHPLAADKTSFHTIPEIRILPVVIPVFGFQCCGVVRPLDDIPDGRSLEVRGRVIALNCIRRPLGRTDRVQILVIWGDCLAWWPTS
jgi:hypothetical protein